MLVRVAAVLARAARLDPCAAAFAPFALEFVAGYALGVAACVACGQDGRGAASGSAQ
jgi:hypothetical protein